MKNLLSNLFTRKQDSPPAIEHVTLNQPPSFDMKAFVSWCKELGVSTRVSKNQEVVVRMGQKEKIVQLHKF